MRVCDGRCGRTARAKRLLMRRRYHQRSLSKGSLTNRPFSSSLSPSLPFPFARRITNTHSNDLNSYLRYLLYFRDPRYSRFLQYPSSLEHLSLLTAPDPAGSAFRNAWREQPLMAQEWAGKMVARWAEWRERETLAGDGVDTGSGAGGEGKANGAAP